MKSIYLLRHAKSSWADGSLSDKQRPLNSRGQQDAPAMGARFAARGEQLDQVLSSPALRAHTTAKLFCEACGFAPGDIVVEPDLYFAGSGSIDDLILAQDDRVRALMLVFHNPGAYRQRSDERPGQAGERYRAMARLVARQHGVRILRLSQE
jgi:phosphohistidine phosphatase